MNLLGGIGRCFSLMGKHKVYYWLCIIADVIFSYAADILFALLNKNVVNSITAVDFNMFMASIWLGLFAIFFYLLSVFTSYGKMRSIRYIMYDMRLGLFKHMEMLSVDYFEKNHSADSIFRLNSNVENMKRAYTNHFPNILIGIVGGVASCIFILTMDLRLGIISLVTCGLTVFINVKYAKPLRKIGNKMQRSEASLLSRLSDLIAGFKVIKLFDFGGYVEHKYEDNNEKNANLRIKRVAMVGSIDSLNHLMNFINGFVIIVIGAVMAAHGYTDFGTVFAILTVQGNVSSMLLNFGTSLSSMQECIAAADMIHEVWNTDAEKKGCNSSLKNDTCDDYIAFKNVSFAYDENGSSVLNKLNISVQKGKIAALVGESGGGKSTVIKLIPKFYEITEGKIYIGGRNINSYTPEELRDLISYVPQDSYLFDASIYENISYGNPKAKKKDIIAAAKAASAHEFIQELPDGYDTKVGERGEMLSGGQKQRIAIARAFLKNSPILLLDEATSALDNENEAIVQKSIEELMKNRTVIVVAHRLTTIENADTIFVIKGGKVYENGTHEELKNKSGIYSELINLTLSKK